MRRRRASKFEMLIDSFVPYAIISIIAITIGEIFFSAFVKPYSWVVDLVDLWILWVFSMDLLFKFEHAASIPQFLKKYWFYIIAIFPFFLVLRVIERFYTISALPTSGSFFILGRYLGGLFDEVRLVKLARIFEFLRISTRLLRAVYFYENPAIRHKINAIKLLGLKKRKR